MVDIVYSAFEAEKLYNLLPAQGKACFVSYAVIEFAIRLYSQSGPWTEVLDDRNKIKWT